MNRRSFLGALAGLPVVAAVQQSWFSKTIAKGTVLSFQAYGTIESSLDDVFASEHPLLQNVWMTIDTTRDIIMGPYTYDKDPR
jgi:hypothetical protein